MSSTNIGCDACGGEIVVNLGDDGAVLDSNEMHTKNDEIVCAGCCGCGRKDCPNWGTL